VLTWDASDHNPYQSFNHIYFDNNVHCKGWPAEENQKAELAEEEQSIPKSRTGSGITTNSSHTVLWLSFHQSICHAVILMAETL
jgi:hypothetical protein